MSSILCDWSKICPDLLRSILEGVSTKDFHRARTVCSNWYSVSTACTRPLYPWRIVFTENSTLLFDPQEDKVHEIEHPGINLSESCVIASCSNWLLLVSSRIDFYLLNVFTCDRINLPSLDPLLFGQATSEVTRNWQHFIKRTDIFSSKKPAVLWMNERTGDFVVAWSYKQDFLFSYKKGDASWSSLEGTKCLSMAYKDYKLYVYTAEDYIKMIDLSGDSPIEIVEGNPYLNHRALFVSQPGQLLWKRRVAITNSGEVLIVLSLKGFANKRFFYVLKMNMETGIWERVDSLGGEMLICGQGVTIRAPIKDINGWGIKSDSICFLEDDLWPDSYGGIKGDSSCFLEDVLWPGTCSSSSRRQIECGVFDLATSTITWEKPSEDSFLQSFWFVPGYALS